ncbi:MAG TPA: Rrf2 family transcriptional regulator [Phycisphaerales bacterium]|nr:Rrf2 family transcriptional regulator [Phycisphaerales bacterium]
MKLSRKSEYACLALIDLAENYSQGLVKVADICRRQEIPKKFLEQILLLLKHAGYVQSTRGAEGGYRLAKPPEKISLADILRLMDGALAPVESVSRYFYEHTPIERQPKLIELFREIRDSIAERMEKTTLADLI